MQVQDWYKLLHQASMGNRHLGVEDSLIYNYLLDELERIDAADEEALVEYISPDSSVVRLNLRPFMAQGGDPDKLFAAMKATWDAFEPSTERLEAYWESLHRATNQADMPFAVEELDAFMDEQRAAGYPAIHHSPTYEEQYRPAYRVLLRRFAAF